MTVEVAFKVSHFKNMLRASIAAIEKRKEEEKQKEKEEQREEVAEERHIMTH